MAEVQMLFPMDPKEFWQKLKAIVEQVMIERGNFSGAAGGQVISRPVLWKVAEVCALLRITKPTVYQWMKTGKLPSVKIESRRYFRKEDVEKLIEASKATSINLELKNETGKIKAVKPQ